MRTKEIRLNGKKYVLSLEEIHKINLIKKALKLQDKLDPLQEELKEIKDELAGMAIALKGDGRMVRLDGIVGEAKVTWERKIVVDPEKAIELKQKLGRKEFELFFEERTEFRPTKELNLLTRSQDSAAKAKKALVMSALIVREQGPYVKIKEK